MEEKTPKCPDCGGRMVKDGWRIINRRKDKKQQYICPSCRRATVNPIYQLAPTE